MPDILDEACRDAWHRLLRHPDCDPEDTAVGSLLDSLLDQGINSARLSGLMLSIGVVGALAVARLAPSEKDRDETIWKIRGNVERLIEHSGLER